VRIKKKGARLILVPAEGQMSRTIDLRIVSKIY